MSISLPLYPPPLDRVQLNDSSLTFNLQSPAHRQEATSLFLFCRYYFCFSQLASLDPINVIFVPLSTSSLSIQRWTRIDHVAASYKWSEEINKLLVVLEHPLRLRPRVSLDHAICALVHVQDRICSTGWNAMLFDPTCLPISINVLSEKLELTRINNINAHRSLIKNISHSAGLSCDLTHRVVIPWISAESLCLLDAGQPIPEARINTRHKLNATLSGDREIWWPHRALRMEQTFVAGNFCKLFHLILTTSMIALDKKKTV